MTIPKKIKIGAHTYQIKIQQMDDMGMTDRTKNIIYLAKGLPRNQMEATLFHEIIHCINNELDHVTVDAIAEGFYQVMKTNKFI